MLSAPLRAGMKDGVRDLLVRGGSKAAGWRSFHGALSVLERLPDRRPGSLRVLTYHRVDWVGARPELSPYLISATPRAFEQQLELVASRYQPVTLEEALEAARGGKPLPARAVMLTFDDAYEDFAEHAWPALKRRALPATLFVPTAFPDAPERAFWWDRVYDAVNRASRELYDAPGVGRLRLDTPDGRDLAYTLLNARVKQLPHAEAMAFVGRVCADLAAPPARGRVLGWDALRALRKEGVTLAPHTRTHPLLNRVSPQEARDEATGSLRDLERETGAAPPVLSYPAGGLAEETVRVLRAAGFELAFTTESGINDLAGGDCLRLRRINVGHLCPLGVVRARLVACAARSNERRPAPERAGKYSTTTT